MKWVRPRCQEAPSNPAAIAAVRPWWASLVTSRTPDRPRATRPPRNPVQTAPSSALPRSSPSSSRWPSAVPAVATSTAVLHPRPPSRTFIDRASTPTTQTGRRPAAGCATPRPPRRAQRRSATPGCWRIPPAHRAGHLLHPPGRHPLHRARQHHRGQCPLGPPARLQQAREGAALAQPRELKLHRADPGVPVAGPGAVAVGHPLGVRWPCSAPIWAATSTSSAPGRACPRPRPGRRHRRCRPCPATPTAPSWTRPPCSCSRWILRAFTSRLTRWSSHHQLPQLTQRGGARMFAQLLASSAVARVPHHFQGP
jgi:hypothetical protein